MRRKTATVLMHKPNFANGLDVPFWTVEGLGNEMDEREFDSQEAAIAAAKEAGAKSIECR